MLTFCHNLILFQKILFHNKMQIFFMFCGHGLEESLTTTRVRLDFVTIQNRILKLNFLIFNLN